MISPQLADILAIMKGVADYANRFPRRSLKEFSI